MTTLKQRDIHDYYISSCMCVHISVCCNNENKDNEVFQFSIFIIDIEIILGI